MRGIWKAGWLLVVVCMPGIASADSWLPATRKEYLSADRQWRLQVDPRPLTGAGAYFEDAVAGKAKPGGLEGDPQDSAVGTMAHQVGGQWQTVWRKPLRNDVAPVAVVVLSGGAFMTLDNWHSMGYGRDAVVLYNASGEPSGHYALVDFLPAEYVKVLPRSVSSLQWRGTARANSDGRTITVPVVIPRQDTTGRSPGAYFPVIFEPRSGTFGQPHGPAWERAKASARVALAAMEREHAAERRRFTDPLFAPGRSAAEEWHYYLREAFYRLDPQWEQCYPSVRVLRGSAPMATDALARWLLDSTACAQVLAAPSQNALVVQLAGVSKAIEPGSLAQKRLYLALDATHFA